MKKHLLYFKYVVLHKIYVFQEGVKLGAPLWQLVIHDWHKFTPLEWKAYADYFYGGERTTEIQAAFDAAWLAHQNRAKHHWQHWVLHQDNGHLKPVEMPDRYRREMLADWHGAGRAKGGSGDDTLKWYLARREVIKMHYATGL